MYLRSLFLLVFLFLFGCNRNGSDEHASTGDQNYQPLYNDTFWQLSEEPLLTIGPGSNEENVQLYLARDGRILPNNDILITNSGQSQMLLFDSTGAFIKQTGQKGRGPNDFGEFSSIKIHPFGTQLLITDNYNDRAHIYDYDLNYLSTINYPEIENHGQGSLLGATENDNLIFLASQGGGGFGGNDGDLIETQQSVFSYIPSTNQFQKITHFPSRRRMLNQVGDMRHFPFIPFDKAPIFLNYQTNSYLLSTSVLPNITVLNSLGEPVDTLQYNAPLMLTEDVWETYSAEIEDWENEEQKRNYRAFYKKPLPLNKYVPAIDAIKVDDNNYIWARRSRVDSNLPQEWDILNTKGEWLGVVNVPYHITITDIGDSYIFGYTYENGDQEFRKYALLKMD